MASRGTQGDLADEEEEKEKQYINQFLVGFSNPGDPAARHTGGAGQPPTLAPPPTPAIEGGAAVPGSRVHIQMTPQGEGIFGEDGFSGFGQPGSRAQRTAVVFEPGTSFTALPPSVSMGIPASVQDQVAVMAQDAGIFNQRRRSFGAGLPVPLGTADFAGPTGPTTWSHDGGLLPSMAVPSPGGELPAVEDMFQELNLQHPHFQLPPPAPE